jgi:hypothetical protein
VLNVESSGGRINITKMVWKMDAMVMAMWVCDIRYEFSSMQGMENIFTVLMFSLPYLFELLMTGLHMQQATR